MFGLNIFSLILLIHAFSSLFMTGVIWIVQILLYPNFKMMSDGDFQAFHGFHTERITWVVAPVMGLELLTGAGLCWAQPNFFFIINFISILPLWILTAFVSVPLHDKLSRNDLTAKEALIRTNWPRTILWSLRSVFWIYLLYSRLV